MIEYRAYQVTQSDLAGGLDSSDWQWLYYEAVAEINLTWFDHLPENWTQWRHGRAFTHDKELAWWRQTNSLYTARLLLTQPPLPPTDAISWGQGRRWEKIPNSQTQFLLHGTLDQDAGNPSSDLPSWSEARIPRWLHYPIAYEAPPERVALKVISYGQLHGSELNQQQILTRWVQLEPADLGGSQQDV